MSKLTDYGIPDITVKRVGEKTIEEKRAEESELLIKMLADPWTIKITHKKYTFDLRIVNTSGFTVTEYWNCTFDHFKEIHAEVWDRLQELGFDPKNTNPQLMKAVELEEPIGEDPRVKYPFLKD